MGVLAAFGVIAVVVIVRSKEVSVNHHHDEVIMRIPRDPILADLLEKYGWPILAMQLRMRPPDNLDPLFVHEFEALATIMVGDARGPDVFFVSVGGAIRLMTTDYVVARDYWRSLPHNIVTCLENRNEGVLACTELETDEHDDVVDGVFVTFNAPNEYPRVSSGRGLATRTLEVEADG